MNRNEIKVIVKSPATTFAHPSGLAVGLCALAVVLIMFTLASPAVWAQGLPLRTCPNGASAYLCQGDIVIADPNAGRNSPGGSTGEGALFLINAATGAQTLISQGSLLTESVGVVVESNGMLVVADRVNGIIRVDPSTGGQTLLPTGAGPSNDFFGIARDANGNFIVADSGLNFDKGVNLPAGRILRIDKTTGAQTVIAPAQGVANNIVHPYGVAIDPLDTSILVSDMSSFGTGAIIRIDPVTLNQHVVWGPTSAFPDVVQSAPFNCPMGITVEASGDILATVFSHSGYGCSNPGIFRVDLMNLFGGGQVTVSANPPVGWALPFGITTEASKNILVVDESGRNVHRANPTYRQRPTGDAQFSGQSCWHRVSEVSTHRQHQQRCSRHNERDWPGGSGASRFWRNYHCELHRCECFRYPHLLVKLGRRDRRSRSSNRLERQWGMHAVAYLYVARCLHGGRYCHR